MRNIDSYDSRYPSEYYEIGTIYSFYGSSITRNLKTADPEYISKYSSKLLELQKEENTNVIQSVGTGNLKSSLTSLQRFYGIVVAKPREYLIKVMIISIHDGINDFFTKDYIVSSWGCLSDGKELMPISSSAKYKDITSKDTQKVGGITRANSSSDVGGITRNKTNDNSAAGIGGITRTQNNSKTAFSNNQISKNSNIDNVGGITRVKNVGCITRVKK